MVVALPIKLKETLQRDRKQIILGNWQHYGLFTCLFSVVQMYRSCTYSFASKRSSISNTESGSKGKLQWCNARKKECLTGLILFEQTFLVSDTLYFISWKCHGWMLPVSLKPIQQTANLSCMNQKVYWKVQMKGEDSDFFLVWFWFFCCSFKKKKTSLKSRSQENEQHALYWTNQSVLLASVSYRTTQCLDQRILDEYVEARGITQHQSSMASESKSRPHRQPRTRPSDHHSGRLQ